MDLSILIVLGTIVAEVAVVVCAFALNRFLNRNEQLKTGFSIRMKLRVYASKDSAHDKGTAKKMSYKDQKESYFDHSAVATQNQIEQDPDQAASKAER